MPNEIKFNVNYTASDRDEFDRLVLAVDRLLSNIRSGARRDRRLTVSARFGRDGIVSVELWENNYKLRDEEHALAFEGVDFITATNSDKSQVTLQIGSNKYLVTLGP